jgi:hypothetical protein
MIYNFSRLAGGNTLYEPTLTSQTQSFLRSNWGNIASVMGLIVSGIAALLARGAKQAAKDARDAVLSSSLAEEINSAQKLAVEVASLVDLGRHDLARFRSNDLHDRTLTIIHRWDAALSTVSKNNFLSAKLQLETLRTVVSRLSATASSPTARQLSQMQASCAKIRDILIEEHASAMKTTDEADNG